MKSDMQQYKKEVQKSVWKTVGLITLALLLGISLFFNIKGHMDKQEADQLLQDTPVISPPEEIVVTPEITLTSAKVAETLESANDLITAKYSYTNWDTYEKDRKIFNKIKMPFTTDKTVFLYSGTIQAGINMSDIHIDVDNDDKVIYLELPKAKILSHEIDEKSFQYFDIKNSIFTSSTLEDYSELRDAMKTKEEENLAKGDFYDEVLQNAKKSIRQLLTISDLTEDYRIVFQ